MREMVSKKTIATVAMGTAARFRLLGPECVYVG